MLFGPYRRIMRTLVGQVDQCWTGCEAGCGGDYHHDCRSYMAGHYILHLANIVSSACS